MNNKKKIFCRRPGQSRENSSPLKRFDRSGLNQIKLARDVR